MNSENLLQKCQLCPRNCQVNRLKNEIGACHVDQRIFLARAALHFWEEPCISGKNGSGTVFFSGCPLNCLFCQNYQIANASVKKEVSLNRLSEIYLELQKKNAHNINLVTPTHYIPQIILSIEKARQNGLKIPSLYNSSGYEKRESLAYLKGFIDIYLPDFKYWDNNLAQKYSHAGNYRDIATKALETMVQQVGKCQFDENNMLQKGVIVRLLVLPGFTTDAKKIIEYLYKTYGDDIYLSIMNQYTPMPRMKNDPFLSQKVTSQEYENVINYALALGVQNAFIQEGDTAQESFIPAFDYEGV